MKSGRLLICAAWFALMAGGLISCIPKSVKPTEVTINGTPQRVSSGKPDLVVGNYQVRYEGCAWDGPSTVRAWVQNLGSGRSEAFEVELQGQQVEMAGLESGEGAYAIVTLPTGPVGSVKISADPRNQIEETVEDNNTYEIMFTPPPPCPTRNPAKTPQPTPTLEPVTFLVAYVPAYDPWFYIDEFINQGEEVEIQFVEGTWTYDPEVPAFGAEGNPNQPICAYIQPGAKCVEPLPTARTGALVGSLDVPQFFEVGNHLKFIAPTSGWLTLRMNYDGQDRDWSLVSGELTVTVTITRN